MKRKMVYGLAVLASGLFLSAASVPDVSAQMQMRGMMDKDSDTSMGMGGMGNRGMMGRGMGMGMQGCMMGAMGDNVTMKIDELKDGVTITLRSDDKNTARRLQICGEMMKLAREMMELQ